MRVDEPPLRTVRQSGRAPVPPVSACAETWVRLLAGRHLEPSLKVGILARIGRFEVVRCLGSGGMGVVMLARDPECRAVADAQSASGLVAIKVPRPELAGIARATERFLTEGRHMLQFEHPHILQVLEIGDSPTQPYIVMPHLRRGNLADHLAQHSPLCEREALRLARELASALLHAHKHGIIHRDLKPANVLLNDRNQAVLTDFGLARTVFNEGVADIHTGHREGTAPYMSPAVARGEAEDTRCDIYGFGALLYEMLSGRPPYTGPSLEAVTGQILRHPPPPVRSLNPSASVPLIRIAQWAMARELRHRYAHMVDLQDDLERVDAGLEPLGPHGHRALLTEPGVPRHTQPSSRPFVALGALLCLTVSALLLWPAPPIARALRRQTTVARADHQFRPAVLPNQTWFVVQDHYLLMLRACAPGHLDVVHRFKLPTPRFALPGAGPDTLCAEVDLVADVNGDGQPELLVRMGDKRSRTASVLACYAVETGQLLWAHHDEHGYLPTILVDLDDDGISSILVTTRASASRGWTTSLVTASGHTRHVASLSHRPVSWRLDRAPEGDGWELVVLDERARLLAFDAELRLLRTNPYEGPGDPP
jgi:serine/threonine protein kinase